MPVKISQLPTASSVTSDDFFPIVDSGSLTTQKASAQQVLNFITGSTFNILNVSGNANVSGNLFVDGRITAQEFYTENISASIIFESGSTKFGNDSTDTHQFSGSVLVSGVINVNDLITATNAQFATLSSSIGLFTNITSSIISGSTGLFNVQTSSNALFTGDIRVLGTASIGQLNTVTQQSLLIGDKYITILSGGVDHTGINGSGFLWGTSSGPGETTGTLGEHAHILYDSSRDALEIFPGLYVTGSTTLFDVSGTIAQFTTITASQYFGVPTTNPGGTNQSIQFNSGSTFSGSNNLIYNYTTNTLSGTTAQFTTLSASNTNISGNLVIDGQVNLAEFPDYAYVLYTASFDKIVVYPGLYVSGNLTGSGLGAFQIVSGSTGLFTTLTGSTITGSIARFTTVTGSILTGSTALFTTVTASNISASSNIITAGNLIVTGSTTLSTISGTTAQFTTITGSTAYFSGNVGIGTASPTYKLDISANTAGGVANFSNANASGYAAADFTLAGTQRFSTGYCGAAQGLLQNNAYFYSQNSDLMIMVQDTSATSQRPSVTFKSAETVFNDNAKNINFRVESTSSQNMLLVDSALNGVGVNKTSPNSTLDVNGNTIVSGNLTVTGSITELSTRRIKTNIQTINNELNNLYKLNPVSYVRLDDGRKEYGFISEEVKEVYPEFVVGEGINYPKMVSVLVSAVKELTQKVQQQQTEIELIKSRGNI